MKHVFSMKQTPPGRGRPLPWQHVTLLGAALTCWAGNATFARTGTTQQPEPVTMTAEQDHRNMMEQLHLVSLRPGAEGFNRNAPNYQNVDEGKANVYTNIPDPLVMNDGSKVKSAGMWWRRRRPGIVEAFDREVYGRVPRHTPRVKWEVAENKREMNGDVPVITKRLIGHVDNSSCPAITVEIHMTLSTPAEAPGPVPVMLEFGFPMGFAPRRPPAGAGGPGGRPGGRPGGGFGGGFPGGGGPTGPTWQQQCLAKGFGYAVIDPTSYQADNGGGLTRGIIGLCNHGQPRKPEDWGALRAWAWGADRALDYFKSDPAVDARQVGIEGLSRYGKAALVTMAYCPRFAIGFIGSSGEAGAKLWRRNYGEQEGNIASSGEYHWMAGNFLKYDGPLTPGDLPVDSNELIALCAPRPVFVSCGSPNVEGTWVDDKGMFQSTALAGPVYRLLGKKDLGTDAMPPMETGLVAGDLAFRQHAGGHTTGPNWPYFLQFAGRYLHAPKAQEGDQNAG
jgi:hypothetical protein